MTVRYFSDHYQQAHQRFLGAAGAAGAPVQRLELDAWDPQGKALSVAIAWLGQARPRRVVLHVSGVHGVEGFAGSAIQLRALARPPLLAPEVALILVHILNPYGMAWLRRANEANVDLNRNFPTPGQRWMGTPPLYHALNAFLNPPSPPAWDAFLPRLLLRILRHGLPALTQAVAAGQHDYPQGLFYGGKALQQGPSRLLGWLGEYLQGVEAVLAIDVHTGLGPWGRESLYTEDRSDASLKLKVLLGARRFVAVPYTNQGGLGTALPEWLPQARVAALTQEFGTYPSLRVLYALREENRWHHYGNGDLAHPSKRCLLQTFCPLSPAWQAAVLEQGGSLLEQAVAALNRPFPEN